MLSVENREAVRLYWDKLLNEHDVAVGERILAPGFLLYDPLSPEPVGRETFLGMLRALFISFPDIHYRAEEEFTEVSKVAIRWTMSATHKGSFMGVAPTGKKVTISGIDMLYLVAGKIEALRIEANVLSLAQQLGALPGLDLG